MRTQLVIALILISFLSYSQTMKVLEKGWFEHYGIVQVNDQEALYDFVADTFITQPADVKILHLDSSFYLVFDKENKNFVVHYLRGNITIKSRPNTEMMVYYGGLGIGVTGDIVSFDNVACHGSEAFDLSHWYSWGSYEQPFYPDAKCLNYDSEGTYRTPIMRITMPSSRQILVERAIQSQATFQLYNFNINMWSKRYYGVLIPRKGYYDMISFKLDSVHQNYYGDMWWEHIQAPHRMKKVTFTVKNGVTIYKPYRLSEEAFNDTINDLWIDPDYLHPREMWWRNRTSPYKLSYRILNYELDSLKKICNIIHSPGPERPVLYEENDTIWFGSITNYRYPLTTGEYTSFYWDQYISFRQGDYQKPIYSVSLEKDRYLRVIYNDPEEKKEYRLKWNKDTVWFTPHPHIFLSGIYDTQTKSWVVEPDKEDVSFVNDDFMYLKEGKITVINDQGEVIYETQHQKDSANPYYQETFAHLLGYDSIVVESQDMALCYKDDWCEVAAVSNVGVNTIPVYAIISKPEKNCIPIVGMNPGSYVELEGKKKIYHIYARSNLYISGRPEHINWFTFSTDALYSGFLQRSHPDLHTGLAHDESPPMLNDQIFMIATDDLEDEDRTSKRLLIAVYDQEDGTALIHNKTIFNSESDLLVQYTGPVTETLVIPNNNPWWELHPPSFGIYKSGCFSLKTNEWLIPPKHYRFLKRYDGITAIERKDGHKEDEYIYHDYGSNHTLTESIHEDHMDSLNKEYLIYPTHRIDTILRVENIFRDVSPPIKLNGWQIYQTDDKYGVMFKKNDWEIEPTYDALVEYYRDYYLRVKGDSITLMDTTFLIHKMEIIIRKGKYGGADLSMVNGTDTTHFSFGYNSLYPDSWPSLGDPEINKVYIDKDRIISCSFLMKYNEKKGYVGGGYTGNYREAITVSLNNASYWKKEGGKWKNIIGFNSNLTKLSFGYFTNPKTIIFPEDSTKNKYEGTGKFLNPDGDILEELTQLELYRLDTIGNSYLGYFKGGMTLISSEGEILEKGDYQYYIHKIGKVFLGRYNEHGEKLLIDGKPDGVWVELR